MGHKEHVPYFLSLAVCVTGTPGKIKNIYLKFSAIKKSGISPATVARIRFT